MTQAKAVIKAKPEDWQVIEEGLTCLEPGSHQRFFVEKTCLNTLDVVDALANALQIEKFEVGYAKWVMPGARTNGQSPSNGSVCRATVSGRTLKALDVCRSLRRARNFASAN